MTSLALRTRNVTANFIRSMSHAVLALGGNVGEVESTFRQALRALGDNGVKVLRTSNLYSSPAMHVTDQPMFLNAAIWVETSLSAHKLLKVAKKVEADAGRDFEGRRWGPRPLDIDIIFHEETNFATEELTIPHPRWQDRAFVCRPVLDLCTPETARLAWWDQVFCRVREAMKQLPVAQLNALRPTWLLKPGVYHTLGSRTLVMGILNVTDDSFSDGGTCSLSQSEERAGRMLEAGADIVDVGGQSTRPGAVTISAAQEAERVASVTERIAKIPGMVVSVDTFYADVARAAVQAGAHIVNDVTAGHGDSTMHETVAQLKVPYIIMHSRGGPGGFHNPQHKAYSSLEANVAAEITQAADAAIQAGIPAWRLMLDAGIGFSKGPADSMKLVTSSAAIRQHLPDVLAAAPQLMGLSRKSFLAPVTGHDVPVDRDFASAAAHALAIAGGADAIRVHHVSAGVDAARVADAALRHHPHLLIR